MFNQTKVTINAVLYYLINLQVVIVNEGDTIRLPCFVDDSGKTTFVGIRF